MSRRKRHSEQTAREIKDIARQLMAEQGTSGLSIRAIAREIGMTPPAIYTYFPSLDDLTTALILDAFNDYADALETARDEAAAGGQSLRDQLMAVTMAYRQWPLDHPVQFQLIYGSPIPGYDAPAELTLPAVLRTGDVFMGLLTRLWATGELPRPDTTAAIPPRVYLHLREQMAPDAPEHVIYGLYDMYSMWVRLHGMISLEVFNHLQGTVGDTEAFFIEEVKRAYRGLGLAV